MVCKIAERLGLLALFMALIYKFKVHVDLSVLVCCSKVHVELSVLVCYSKVHVELSVLVCCSSGNLCCPHSIVLKL